CGIMPARMRCTAALRPALWAIVLLMGAGPIAATPSDNLITLEWLVANSALVVRGRLVGEVSEFSSSGQISTVEIYETLKGPPMARVTFFSQGFIIKPVRDRAVEVLVSLEQHR